MGLDPNKTKPGCNVEIDIRYIILAEKLKIDVCHKNWNK